MDEKDIIRMAREAGMVYREFEDEFANANTDGVDLKTMIAFAKLIADAKRDHMVFRATPHEWMIDVIEAEREGCAKVCDELDAHREVATLYSQAIRARGQQ